VKPLAYIAGPYKSDPVGNTRKAWEVADELILGGLVTPIVPHLTLLADAMVPQPEAFWLHYDLDVLEHCDAVLRLPGESWGADAEVEHADGLSVPTFFDKETLLTWARGWHSHRHCDADPIECSHEALVGEHREAAARIADVEARLAAATHDAVVARDRANLAVGILRKILTTGDVEQWHHEDGGCALDHSTVGHPSIDLTDAEAALLDSIGEP
jgi:hypothetical protein